MTLHRTIAAVLWCLVLTSSVVHGATGQPTLEPVRTTTVEVGVELSVYHLPRDDGTSQEIWIYRPVLSTESTFPLVLVPPAGGTLITAPPLSEADMPEHLPWVRAGFVVVSFSLRGVTPEVREPAAIVKAATAFKKARAGVDDAASALEFALATVPKIDPKRVFAAGHSSAGTLVLLWTALEPRVRGVAAFAPVWDVPNHFDADTRSDLDTLIPGHAEFLHWSSPSSHADALKVPVMLFHAEDDEVGPKRRSVAAATAIRAAGGQVEFRSTPSGGHYQAMLDVGVPGAVRWIKLLVAP